MIGSTFSLEGLHFRTGRPDDISLELWQQMQSVATLSYASEMPDKAVELGYVMHEGNVERFAAGRIDPQVDVDDGRLNPGLFKNAFVAAAESMDGVVAYGIVYDNTSPPLERAKMVVSPSLRLPKLGHRRYAWVREIVVNPYFQHRGVASTLGAIMLNTRRPRQPSTVYEWNPSLTKTQRLEHLGYKAVGGGTIEPFGPGSESVDQVRFVAASCKGVTDNIKHLNYEAGGAIHEAKKNSTPFA